MYPPHPPPPRPLRQTPVAHNRLFWVGTDSIQSCVGTFIYLVWEWSVELPLIGHLISDFVNKGI